ncbi:Phosphoserine phosphatase RsbU [Streptomyces sp. MBT84]|uniref:PP2C family protein-serine/threonine phosphatase n=1 Tax=Streptomyces sp. MBT84 TaxID=1488414 RepID=UPI001D981D7C|nr:PP2C family protein-serine/threonine phosphatase [Streptomyces sp. MBT84]MBW8698423.1 Phosphoserine phosphatase RsbU [Streptomyces sp. MBT84]
MSDMARARARVLGDLIAASHLMALDQMPTVVARHAAGAGWTDVFIYLADLQQERLHLLAGEQGGDVPPELAVEGTVAGRAFQLGEVFPASASSSGQWWVPLLDGIERLGVLRVRLPDGQEPDEDLGKLAGLIGLLLVSKRGTSDSYARLVRRRRMKVVAEMEWRLMPPRTFATDRILISAVMEPAYEVSGDAFDYALAGDTLHMAVFDAMGHDTAAGLTANLALATCRSFRREGADLLRTADGIEEALAEQFRGGRFATGILASLNTTTGVCTWISCGHYPPVIVRGRRTIVHLSCAPSPPLGTELGLSASVCREQLEPGDRLLLYTDGVTEARNADGQEFGLEGLTDFLIRHNTDDLPVPETLRRLVRHHLDYHRGKLNDDATILLLEWHGPAPFRPESLESLVGLPPSTSSGEPLAPP